MRVEEEEEEEEEKEKGRKGPYDARSTACAIPSTSVSEVLSAERGSGRSSQQLIDQQIFAGFTYRRHLRIGRQMISVDFDVVGVA
jgi:hypothetical protein